jgi:hypothetical protein
MSMRIICAQLFGFAALLAALFVLPQAAQAHPGHAHGARVHAQPATPSTPAPAVHAVEQHADQLLTAAVDRESDKTDGTPCSRGCCAQSSCAACFSLVAPMPPLVAPPSLSTEMTFAAKRLPPGIGGPSLRRPPRSFA